ncbi:HEAT repeat-containing protein 5B-like [Acanthaster planci]|uniref:HEAT repeat-containing protein 5A n=1 Tax=Acanthaster planci TaxID=133434 RepID=A0A8B7Y077_ACAPL|nr:HEAT repeat-containing protein 5B-like [Acanthaster planci]XP_022085920.1 HEAT repeat-containing protein 5B-like [Acanthaster planci]XP_022085921.1 HEAT repeat-containing protein 5B-like [Acanthaster planci]XP_022085922.1 HEAT repeat-containing protein 5B-like [Acanthaster planci]
MELSHSLLLNEQALAQIAESKRPIFIYEWLRFLDKVLVAAQKSDLKGSQKKLVAQLTNQITESPGPPTRALLGKCIGTVFSVGDSFDLLETSYFCNDIIKNKDDSPSFLPSRLAAVAVLGAMYEKLGRMMGSSFPETIQGLLKALKNAESTGRCEIMLCLQRIVKGLGSAAQGYHRDIYKAVRTALLDRSMAVRCAAAKCMLELVKEGNFLHTTELENMVSTCFRALDGSNYDVRSAVSKLLGVLLATTQTNISKDPRAKRTSMEDVYNLLSVGFVKGTSGFLKAGGGEQKGGGMINREVRVGFTHAYVVFVRTLGGLWLERNLQLFLERVLDIVANPRCTPTHVDAVYLRRCITFILRSTLGDMLGEKAQVSCCKQLCGLITNYMNTVAEPSEGSGHTQDNSNTQHVLICAMQELGSLVKSLSTCASTLVTEPNANMCDTVTSVLLHPSPAARLASAWCLRCIAVALPSQLTPLLDRCTDRLNNLKSSPEAVSGYSFTIAALLGGVRDCPLGIPHAKGKAIFSIAEDLLRTASQNSRMSLHRTQASWLILGAVMTLGSPVVRNHLPRLLLLWRNAFPRSSKELESEKARGDAFTWQVTLEGRAGALCAMQSFITHCPDLVTEDVIRRCMTPLECAMSMLAEIHTVIKSCGAHLKASAAMVRLRLYEVLRLLPPTAYEGSFTALLRELVAEFTLTDNAANTTTSLLRSLCHENDSIILQSWITETDHKSVELQLQPNSASGSGALEHDPSSLYWKAVKGEDVPGPLPLGVAVIDASVALFGVVIPHVADKHRLKILEHFGECIRQAKSARQQAVQINVFTGVLSALKGLAENKRRLKNSGVRVAANNLIMNALTNSNPILRCAAGEALGRMAQMGGDNSFIAQTAQMCFDRLKTARDAVSRTGNSLALGCLHRYVGGMGAGQHLNTSVSILLALAQDSTSPTVQMWALHALALIADSGGPMFRSYVEPTLSLVLTLLLSVPPSNVEVHQCLGRCLAALITTLGPELQGNKGNLATARTSCLVACAIMQDHPDSLVGSEAIACLQQLHMFAPRHVNLTSLVPHLCTSLGSQHLLLRRAAVACLRQLSQREAQEVCEYAKSLAKDSRDTSVSTTDGVVITDTGLEGVLFSMLDKETDQRLLSNIHDTLISMLHELSGKDLARWLTLCKTVLSASKDSGTGPPKPDNALKDAEEKDEKDEDQEIDDSAKFKTGEKVITHPPVAPRWPTRVFAADSVRRVIQVCDGNTVHFDLALAREMKAKTSQDNYLVLHLSDLVRTAFIAATSESTQLRNAGLLLLQDIINKFARVPEPEFPGHFIMEQYQAQVGAALRPAFSPDTPSDVTAMACQVSSAWIGSGVAHDLNDLRRVHQLLVSSLAKLQVGKGAPAQIYSESASTMEKLAVIKAWAEVYIVAMKQHLSPSEPISDQDGYHGNSPSSDSLLHLVQPELVSLSKYWLSGLRDHALLALPPDFSSQLPQEGGAFYSSDAIATTRPHYQKAWSPIVYAAALWLNSGGFQTLERNNGNFGNLAGSGPVLPGMKAAQSTVPGKTPKRLKEDYFHLILGVCVEALSSQRSAEPIQSVHYCLQAVDTLLDSAWPRSRLSSDPSLAVELLNVMHRLLLTRETLSTHLLVTAVVKRVIQAMEEQMVVDGKDKEDRCEPKPNGGGGVFQEEGGESGEIVPGSSVVFATLEVCLCLLVRQLPALNPTVSSAIIQSYAKNAGLSEEASVLISTTVSIMAGLPELCSPAGSVSVLPTILFLTTGVLRETAEPSTDGKITTTVSASLQALRMLMHSRHLDNPTCVKEWVRLLRSALATVLDFARPGKDKTGVDENSVLLAVAVFVSTAPTSVTAVPGLQCQAMELFKKTMHSDEPLVKLKSLQTMCSVFQCKHREIATPFIHALGPRVVEYLHGIGSNKPDKDSEVPVVLEAVRVLEVLVSLTDDGHRVQLLSLLVPILISLLVPSAILPSTSRQSRALHEQALQRLVKIGPLYPAAFKTVVGGMPELKAKLEAAIRANQAAVNKQKTQHAQVKPVAPPAAPSIKLKMDFSNFSG